MGNQPTHLDLFSGIGGFALAAQWAGFQTTAFCEIEPFCQKVLRKNFGKDIIIYDDIKRLDASKYNGINLVTGGFPCQDISHAGGGKHFGKRNQKDDMAGSKRGLSGGRSGLWFEFIRIIDEANPEWVVIENVPSLRTSSDGRDIALILQGLAERGYLVAWAVTNSRYFGAATARRRIWIVGHLDEGRGSPARLLFEQLGIGKIFPDPEVERNKLPMFVGWDGGLTLERLRQCVLTKTYPTGTGKRDGLSRRLDKDRYRAIGNAIVPQQVFPILKEIYNNILLTK